MLGMMPSSKLRYQRLPQQVNHGLSIFPDGSVTQIPLRCQIWSKLDTQAQFSIRVSSPDSGRSVEGDMINNLATILFLIEKAMYKGVHVDEAARTFGISMANLT